MCIIYLCNLFDLKWHNRDLPHRSGGRGIPAGLNYALSYVLQNIFGANLSIISLPNFEYRFRHFCVSLAEELWDYAKNQ